MTLVRLRQSQPCRVAKTSMPEQQEFSRDLDSDWAEVIQQHAQRLANGEEGLYDRFMVVTAGDVWVEVTDQVHEQARRLGWTG